MKKVIYTLALGLAATCVQAQVVNSTKIHVSEGALVSFGTDVVNNGEISNNGNMHLKGDLKNNAKLTSKGEVTLDGQQIQNISGSNPVEFSKVSVNNDINLETALKVSEEINFQRGIVNARNGSALELSENATQNGASDFSHVYGVVKKSGSESFEFPVGDGASLRSFETKNTTGGTLEAEYVARNPLDVASTLDFNVESINQTEYWTLKSSANSGKVDVKLKGNDDVAYLKSGVWVKETNSLNAASGLREGSIFTSGKGKNLTPEIGVWPNPTQGEFNLKLTGMRDTDNITVDLTNQDGRVIMKMKGTVKELRKAYNLPNGMVTTNITVRVINGEEAMTQNLILNR